MIAYSIYMYACIWMYNNNNNNNNNVCYCTGLHSIIVPGGGGGGGVQGILMKEREAKPCIHVPKLCCMSACSQRELSLRDWYIYLVHFWGLF